MLKTIENPGEQRRSGVLKHPVKLTALLYLKEAIQKEKYEEAPEFIEIAREFGAKEREIEELLEDSRRTPR